MSDWKSVDFAALVKDVKQSQVGKDSLSIWGGRCAESALLEFLKGWDLSQMPYWIWEYVSNIVFQNKTLPDNPALLQRGRLFGEGGDLEVRRDGADFAWRFIGPAEVQPPDGNYAAQDYWADHTNVMFFQDNATALLWGKRDGEQWHDDRVGAAKLDYPAIGERVQIHYKTFSRAGRVEFVWYTGLSEWKEADGE